MRTEIDTEIASIEAALAATATTATTTTTNNNNEAEQNAEQMAESVTLSEYEARIKRRRAERQEEREAARETEPMMIHPLSTDLREEKRPRNQSLYGLRNPQTSHAAVSHSNAYSGSSSSSSDGGHRNGGGKYPPKSGQFGGDLRELLGRKKSGESRGDRGGHHSRVEGEEDVEGQDRGNGGNGRSSGDGGGANPRYDE